MSTSGTVENWQDLEHRERMAHLLNTGHLSDCSFSLLDDSGEVQEIKCHQFVLISSSPVFEGMFKGDTEEARNPHQIVMIDVSASNFTRFLEYVYLRDNNKLHDYSVQVLQNLIYLSRRFMVSTLTTNCLISLGRRLSRMGAKLILVMYEYAVELDEEIFMISVEREIVRGGSVYINNEALFELNMNTFYKIMNILRDLPGRVRFAAIEKYCLANDLVDSEARKLLDTIDFDMSATDFCQGPGKSKLLTMNQKYSILSQICLGRQSSVGVNSENNSETLNS